jgi:hypothetical protein
MAENENTSYKSHLQVMESLDITQDELDNIEVELE